MGRLRTLRYAILWDELTQKGSLHGLCNDPFYYQAMLNLLNELHGVLKAVLFL